MLPAADKTRQRGLTLVELIVTMMIISVSVLAITNTLSFAFRHQSDGLWQTKSVALAQSYIEEIAARRYDETTPNGGVPPCSVLTTPCSAPGADGEARAEFDDVDDYHGLDESPPLDAQGNPRTGYPGFRVAVSVSYADATQIAAFNLDDATDAKLVTVSVTPPNGTALNFPVLRTNY